MTDSDSSIRVLCRFRPLNEKEQTFSDQVVASFPPDRKTVQIHVQDSPQPVNFAFDYIFPSDTTQRHVYEIAAQPVVQSVMEGFNGTVFAYGQTSSGKTFTMTGASIDDIELKGIIPRMVATCFETIEETDRNIEFAVKVGYCEIYLEKIKDLLNPTKSNLQIKEDKTNGVFIADLTEQYVSNQDEVYELMRIGTSNREVGYTHMNAGSSRSHSIFILTVQQNNLVDLSAKSGRLYLVDLAGSEKVGKTGAAGKRLDEAKNINKSLSALGNVINALTDGKSQHVPYRDSKLTRVLQDSLGGNAKTSLIITCSPSIYNVQETLSTLRFGMRAKTVKNRPKVNREYTIPELKLLLSKAQEQIAIKDKIISDLKRGEYVDENSTQQQNEQADQLEQEINDLRIELDQYKESCNILRCELEENSIELFNLDKSHQNALEQLQELQAKYQNLELSFNEQKDTIESFNLQKEVYENELAIVGQQKIDLEQQLQILKDSVEDQTLVEQNNQENQKLQAQISKLTLQLEKETQEKNIALQQLEMLNEQEDQKDESKQKISQDSQQLLQQYQSKQDENFALKLALDESYQTIRGYQNLLSQGEHTVRSENERLKKNLNNLYLNYNQLLSTKSRQNIEQKTAQKKIQRQMDRIRDLESELKHLNHLNRQTQETIEQLQTELEIQQGQRKTVGHIMKKVIRGGKSSPSTISFDFPI